MLILFVNLTLDSTHADLQKIQSSRIGSLDTEHTLNSPKKRTYAIMEKNHYNMSSQRSNNFVLHP